MPRRIVSARLDADAVGRQQLVQRVDGRDGLAVELHHHVSLAQARARAGPAGAIAITSTPVGAGSR